ncbi:MAG: hypothetical protein ACRCWJ_13230, partial [Casimicrobium sp.]
VFGFQIDPDFVAFALPYMRTVCGLASRHDRFENRTRLAIVTKTTKKPRVALPHAASIDAAGDVAGKRG